MYQNNKDPIDIKRYIKVRKENGFRGKANYYLYHTNVIQSILFRGELVCLLERTNLYRSRVINAPYVKKYFYSNKLRGLRL